VQKHTFTVLRKVTSQRLKSSRALLALDKQEHLPSAPAPSLKIRILYMLCLLVLAIESVWTHSNVGNIKIRIEGDAVAIDNADVTGDRASAFLYKGSVIAEEEAFA